MAFRLSIRLVLMTSMALMLAIASAHPMSQSLSPKRPQKPSKDPFYQPPEGFENEPPGTILRTRSVDVAFLKLIPDPVLAYQILYRTTDLNGDAIATVTTVFKPVVSMPDRFVSFHTAYDSSATKCDPSYTYQLDAPRNNKITSAEMFILQIYLMRGYVVASPDYEGPDAAFSPGHLEGMGVLDNMRAVSSLNAAGFNTENPMIVGIGYSGGAIATGWAGSLQPTYAPELNMKGWAHGGTPANLTGTLLNIDGTPNSGYIPIALDGFLKRSAYAQELGPIFQRYVTDKGRKVLKFANHHCAVKNLNRYSNMSLFSKDIQTAGKALIYDPVVATILRENVLGVRKDETPTAPVFVYHGIHDQIIPYSNASKMVDDWCSYGADVKFTSFAKGGHAETEINGVPHVVQFVEAAFAGMTKSGCSRDTQPNSDLNPSALGPEYEPILVRLVDALAQMGDQNENLETLKTPVST